MSEEALKESQLAEGVAHQINRVSAENGSNTPDFILAEFMVDCLKAWNAAVNKRERWYGRWNRPGQSDESPLRQAEKAKVFKAAAILVSMIDTNNRTAEEVKAIAYDKLSALSRLDEGGK